MNSNQITLSAQHFVEYVFAMCVLLDKDEIALDKFEEIVYDLKEHAPKDFGYIFNNFRFEKTETYIRCEKLREEIGFAKTFGLIGNYTTNNGKKVIQMDKEEATRIVEKYKQDTNLYKTIYFIAQGL